MPRKRAEAIETTEMELAKEIIRAKKLCQKEEEECSDAETLGSDDSDDSDYEYDSEEEEEDSFGSSFIDDTEVDEEEARRALKSVTHAARRIRIRA